MQGHLKEAPAMIDISLIAILAAAAIILPACAIQSSLHVSERKAVAALSTCPELEGYPDCQDGHQVDPRAAALRIATSP
jgi:hypothetical protein